MKLYDRYLLRAAASSTVMALAIMLILFLAIDLLVGLDALEGQSVTDVLMSYLYKIPPVLYLLLPLVSLLGGMAALARLLRARELLPLRVAGIRSWRALMAFWMVGLIAAGVAFSVKNFVLPKLGEEGQSVLAQFSRRAKGGEMMIKDNVGNVWLVGSYQAAADPPSVENVMILQYSQGRVARTISAPKLEYKAGNWHGEYVSFEVSSLGTPGARAGIESAPNAPVVGVDLPPALLALRGDRGGERSIASLLAATKSDPNPPAVWFELYQRFCFPLLCVSLLMIGAVIALRRDVGSLFAALAMAALVALLSYAAVFVSQSMVERGSISPELASFGPALLLFVIAGVGLRFKAD